jgi:thiol:disulfide interchange protein
MRDPLFGSQQRAGFRRVRRRFLALATVLCTPFAALAARETRPLPPDFDPARDPAQDLDTALRIAKAARRNVLIEVGGDWCTWCRILERFFAANPELKKLRDVNYVWLKVNFSKENANEAFLRRFPPVAGYPHIFVLDANGRLLHSQNTEALEAGKDYDPAAMRAFLVKWAPDR